MPNSANLLVALREAVQLRRDLNTKFLQLNAMLAENEKAKISGQRWNVLVKHIDDIEDVVDDPKKVDQSFIDPLKRDWSDAH